MEDVIDETDKELSTTQYTLIDYLKDVEQNTENIYIDKKLYGVLDLSIIDTNYKNVNHICLGEGNITEIINFPENLKKFECSKNLLSSLLNLPSGIVEIDVSHNMLTMLDLKPLTKLKKLNCSWNRLNSLTELSDTMTDLIVNDNNINEIDLSGLVNLEKICCINNSGIILKNVPVGVIVNGEEAFTSDERTFSVVGGSKTKDDDDDRKDGYEDVLNKYFKLKHDYKMVYDATKRKHNENLKKSKKNKPMPTPNCVRCKRKGGTLFSKTNDRYYAVCGNPKICFEIEINTKSRKIKNLEESMNRAKEKVESSKEDIIKHKMDTLFGYIQKGESSTTFLKKAEKYAEDNVTYEESLKDFNNVFNNVERDDSIQKEELMINSYLEEMNDINSSLLSSNDESREIINNDLVKMQINVADMNKKLTLMKYEYNSVTIKVDEKDDSIKKSKLNQNVVKFENMFMVTDEPEVLKFNFFPY